MAETYSRLGAMTSTNSTTVGQVLLTATNPTIVSTVTVCNTAATAATYYLYLIPASGATASTTYATATPASALVHGATLAANDTVTLTLGLVLESTNNRLIASANSTTVGFQAFGVTVS